MASWGSTGSLRNGGGCRRDDTGLFLGIWNALRGGLMDWKGKETKKSRTGKAEKEKYQLRMTM